MKEKEVTEKLLIHTQAFTKWGYDSQRLIWIEEMAELTQALAKSGRKFNPSTEKQIQKEVVDVALCVEQMIILFFEGTEFEDTFKVVYERYKELVLNDRDNREENEAS